MELDKRTLLLSSLWSGEDGYMLAKKAQNMLNSQGYYINLSDEMPSGFGTTTLMSDGSLQYNIGIQDLYENRQGLFLAHKAIAPTVVCFHEVCGHGGQWRNEFKKDTPLSKVLALNDLACKSSYKYYGIGQKVKPKSHYFRQPHEVAAQYMGLRMTQKFLSTIYDEEVANKLLCNYINQRMISKSEFISSQDETEPFTSMEQVYDQFQKTFVEQVFAPTHYKVSKNSVDFPGLYINNQKWPWERSWSRTQINHISDRLTQTYVLSAIWLNEHEYGSWVKELPVFENMNFPENISHLIQNGPDPPKEDDLNLELLTEDEIDLALAVEDLTHAARSPDQQIR